MTPEQNYSIVSLLNDIKKLLEKQNELLDTVLTNGTSTQTKITVVGNKATTNTKGLNNTDDFTL
jgi:hypothetical protein